jgi:hypothetical protein
METHPVIYYVKLIREQKTYADLLLKNCPAIAADIVTYQANPNCSCRKKIEDYINSNREIVKQVYAQFLSENPTYVPEKLEENIAGRVIEIDADPIKYKKMIDFLAEAKQTYKGLSVMDVVKEENGVSKTVWIVFFY